MNASLASQLANRSRRTLHWHPLSATSAGVAVDGMHPSCHGYAVWADGLSRHILAGQDKLAK